MLADRGGFESFYQMHLARIVRACTLVLLDQAAAEDVAAEAFTRLWSHWGSIVDDDHAGGYVFTTAMHLCWRRRRLAAREVVGPVADRSGVADRSSQTDVFDALKGLSVRQRQAVVMRDWAGFETKEIADRLGMRESTVRVHLARGREALRRSLRVEEREP